MSVKNIILQQKTNPKFVMKSLAPFFIAFVFSLNIYADTVSEKEKNALIKFYHATNGLHWKIKWDLSLSVSKWYGVQVEEGKVTAINLSANNLQGELPAEFFNLASLKVIDLHQNTIKGQLPASISNLKDLEVLDISNNRLSGSLPKSICELKKLKDLEVFKNEISGELPVEIGKLNQLEILALFENELKGDLPESLYKITTLKVLLLNNKLTGILRPEIINFHALQNLSLFDNNFEGEIPNGLGKLYNLAELNLSYNKFKGTVSKNLALLDALNMTMFDENDNPFLLEINTEKETTIITKNE